MEAADRSHRQDAVDHRAGVTYLLKTLGASDHRPSAILTGNGIDRFHKGNLDNTHGSLVESAYGRSPNYMIINADVRHGRPDPEAREVPGVTVDDMRRFRLALATTCLGDGYFAFDRGNGNHAQFWWFPEYEIDLGNPLPDYVAPSSVRVGTPEEPRYGVGTYSRELGNGTVIVNSTSDAKNITFATARRDASTGIWAMAFVIPPNDGRIYTTTAPQ